MNGWPKAPPPDYSISGECSPGALIIGGTFDSYGNRHRVKWKNEKFVMPGCRVFIEALRARAGMPVFPRRLNVAGRQGSVLTITCYTQRRLSIICEAK